MGDVLPVIGPKDSASAFEAGRLKDRTGPFERRAWAVVAVEVEHLSEGRFNQRASFDVLRPHARPIR